MAVTVPPAQAKLKIDMSGAVPGHEFDTQRNLLLGHLTKGFSGTDWVRDALECKGTATIIGPAADVGQTELGFVQIARAISFQAFYAGRIASEGSIALDYFKAPAIATTILLDGVKQARDPWYRNPVLTVNGGQRVADTGDHPGMVVRLSLENRSRSNVRNFLFHAFMDREFWTILTAVENGGSPIYVSYFQWQVRYEFKVNWVNKSPVLLTNSSFVKLIKGQTAGRPPDADIQALLNAPSGDRANKVGTRAEAVTLTGNPPNRTDMTTRFVNVPPNFWT